MLAEKHLERGDSKRALPQSTYRARSTISGAPVIIGAENDLHKNAARAILFVLPLAADKIRAGDVSGVKNFLAGPAIVL